MNKMTSNKFTTAEDSLMFAVSQVFEKIKALDKKVREQQEELDHLRAHVRRITAAKPKRGA